MATMAERREIAESALKSLCARVGVAYTTESQYVEGAWFLESVTRGRVNIAAWCEGSRHNGRSIKWPLESYGQNLTHAEVYDRAWFADRCFTAKIRASRIAMNHMLSYRAP